MSSYSLFKRNFLSFNSVILISFSLLAISSSFTSFLIDNDSGATTGLIEAIRNGATADTNETSGTEGYVDGANDDFNLTSSATLRRTEIIL